jgi:hypothetical protein
LLFEPSTSAYVPRSVSSTRHTAWNKRCVRETNCARGCPTFGHSTIALRPDTVLHST